MGDSSGPIAACVRPRRLWSKPESDLPSDLEGDRSRVAALIAGLGGHFRSGFPALFCDGSVRFIRTDINPVVLRTRDGGEVVSADAI
jgi:hypothetical protein